MPVITSVEPQKKNSKRFNVFLDGKFAFGADEDLVVNFRLTPKKEISQEDLEKILFEAEVGKLMEKMYNWFSFRQRSEKEVRNYFKIKNQGLRIKEKEEYSEFVIENLIEKLKQKGLINDLEFAKAWVESRRRSKQKGINALKAELYQKGISGEIIEEVISDKVEVTSEEELAKKALEKKTRAWKNLPEQEFKKKATGFLLRKGFEYSVIKRLLIVL